MTYPKLFRVVLGGAIATFFLWLIFRQINTNQIVSVFLNLSVPSLVLATMLFFIGYACRVRRWQLMLMQENANIRWVTCAGPLFASVAANNILPFRAGDIYRAFFFNSKLKINTVTSLMSLFIERLLDLFMVLVFLGLAIHFLKIDTIKLIGISHSLVFILSMVILSFLIFPKYLRPFSSWLCNKIESKLPNLGLGLHVKSEKMFGVLNAMYDSQLMVKLVAWSFLAWFMEGLVFFTIAKAIHSLKFPLAAWIALPVGTLATTIPSTPGYIGTFDYFISQSMIILGNNIDSSTAYAFLLHAVLWLPITILGGVYILLNTFRRKNNA